MNPMLNPSKPAWLMILVFALILLLGCEPKSEEMTEDLIPEKPPLDPMTALIIGEPELGPKIVRQWAAKREGELTVIDRSLDDWIASDFSIEEEVDLVIYPPIFVGELAERKRIKKIERDIWNGESINKNSLLSHYRRRLVRYANEPYGLPLGNPHFAMVYHLPRLGGNSEELPTTWKALERRLGKLTGEASKLDAPLAKDWAAWVFLSRVAPDVRERGAFSVFFDRNEMKPLINTEPFVEALKELKRITSQRSLEMAPGDVYRLAASGQSTAAICFPSSGFDGEDPTAIEERETLKFVSLPGSEKFFNQRTGQWKERFDSDQNQVDVFGFSGLMASVTTTCRYEATAWELLAWVSDNRSAASTVAGFSTVGPFRASHLGDPTRWLGEQITLDLADEYTAIVENIHERPMVLMFPRMLAGHRYLSVLDDAVREYLTSEVDAQKVLDEVAVEWNAITKEVGRRKMLNSIQRDAGF